MEMKYLNVFFISILAFGLIIWTLIPLIQPTTQHLLSHAFIGSHQPVRQKTTNNQAYTPHPPILITSNSHFVSQGFSGSGTPNDPYRIENLNITASNGDLMSISDTTVYFCISNNYLNGLTTTTTGISLFNVQHVKVENNSISNNGDGIKTTNTSNAIFLNNSVYSSTRFGFFLINASNCIFKSNSIHDNLINGIHL
ncbi:MAG: right-handed parallel beta-helix repeat-containing protein, partial [Candidatus Hermodarchaeota archaeon]